MSKRKSAAAPKRTRGSKLPARAQRNKHSIVKSPKVNSPASVSPGSNGLQSEVHHKLEHETPAVDNRVRAAALEAILQASLQSDRAQKTEDNNSTKGIDFSLPLVNVQAFQAKLLELTQANLQFAFDLAHRLATVKSPFEFWAVIAEFTGRRIVMVGQHSKELAAFWRLDSFRGLAALPGQ